MAAVFPPLWKNPPTDFLGLLGRCSDRPPKHILKVSACFSKCPGFNKNPANLPVLLVVWMSFVPLDRFAARLKKRLGKNYTTETKFVLHLCKLETCTYISLAAMYGLTAITKILVAG